MDEGLETLKFWGFTKTEFQREGGGGWGLTKKQYKEGGIAKPL